MTLVDRSFRMFGVQPAERALLLWGIPCLILMGAAGIAILNTAEALFLKRVGVEALPIALMVSSGLLVATTAAVGTIAARDPARWLPRILAALALAPLPFVALAESQSPLVMGALVVLARQLMALGVLAFWLAMGSLVPVRRAKHLFAPLAAGATVGGIIGSFGSEPLARWFGVGGLLAFAAGMLAASVILSLRLRHCGTRQLEHALGGRPAPAKRTESASALGLSRESRLFRLIGITLLCGGALSPILYFQFTSVLDAATQGPGGERLLLGLLSQFRGWVSLAMLVSQVWLSGILYRRFGVPLTLVLWPISYLIGFTWLGLDFALVAAFMSFGAARVTEEGTSESGIRILYNLFSDDVRARASGLLEGPARRLGGMLGNAFVLTAIFFGAAAWVGWSALPIAGLWVASSIVLWRAYPSLLLRASAEHGLAGADIDRAALLDTATLRSLAASLLDPDPRICGAAIDLLVDGDRTTVVRLLAQAFEHAPSANRPLLVATLQQLVESSRPESVRSLEAAEALASALRARPPLPEQERADLLQVYARLTSGDDTPQSIARASRALLDRALGDPAAPVRLASIVELHRRGSPPPGLPDLDRTLAQALDASDALIRRAARKALRAILVTSAPDARWSERLQVLAAHLGQRADRAETAEALRDVARRHGEYTAPVSKDALRHADDRDPRVRGALLAMAGHASLAQEGPRLVSALGARASEEAEGAREGLVALGTDAALPLLVGLEFGGPSRRDAVLSVLHELEVDSTTLESLRAHQLQSIQQAVMQRAALEDLPGEMSALLRRRLEERISEGLGALLDLIAAIYEDPELAELERRLRRARSGRERDLLVEAIETSLGRAERDTIVPLLETGEWPARGATAASRLNRPLPDSAEVLADLRFSADATTRTIVSSMSLDQGEAIGDPESMRSEMDIAVRLQDVPLFDRLNTQQLVSLAELVQTQRVASGERIYAAGEEGLGLYLVLEGEVELRRGPVVVERAAEDSFFGELAALDGLPRSADAVASVDALVLRLERDDLLRLLDEVPGLSIGLVQLLSSRVRRLVERLDESEPQAEESA